MRAGVFLGSFYGAGLPRITNTGSPVSEKNSSRNCLKNPNRRQIEALGVRKTGQKHYSLTVIGPQIYCCDSATTTFQTVSLGSSLNKPAHLRPGTGD